MKKENGITLIALIITIIVMLILVAVTINMTVNRGLFDYAGEAKRETEKAIKEEKNINGDILKYYVDVFDYEKNVNIPRLAQGMSPVNYNTTTKEWETCSLGEWDWDYIEQDSTTENGGTSKWANARTEDGSMWVWIPRFAYRIEGGYHTGVEEGLDVVFLVGTTNKDKEGNDYATTYDMAEATTNKYMEEFVVHPAFGSDLTQGGWGSEITGFWVAKFEAGFPGTENANADPTSIDYTKVNNSTIAYTSNLAADLETEVDSIYGAIIPDETLMKYPVFKDDVFSYVYATVGDIYGLCKSLNSPGNPYGFTSGHHTHLIKNSEWGAVAYLAYSKYGRNGTSVTINNYVVPEGDSRPVLNNSTFFIKTGYSSTIDIDAEESSTDVNKYNEGTGYLGSSTGNVYGVYDLSGGALEYTSAYCDTLDTGAIHSNGSAGPFYAEYGSYLLAETDMRLKTLLTRDLTQTSQASSWATHNNVFGDAMWETASRGNQYDCAWLNDRSHYPYSVAPFVMRSGTVNYQHRSGIFAFICGRGNPFNTNGFRVCVVGTN